MTSYLKFTMPRTELFTSPPRLPHLPYPGQHVPLQLTQPKTPQTAGAMLSPFLLSRSTCNQMAVLFYSTLKIDSELTTSNHWLLFACPSSHHLPLVPGQDVWMPLPATIPLLHRPDRLLDPLLGELWLNRSHIHFFLKIQWFRTILR